VPKVLCYVRVCEDAYSVTSLKQKDRHAEVVARCLDIIYQGDDQELIDRFRRSALMPQHEVSLFLKLLAYRSFRRHLSLRLAGWTITRQLWSLLRPWINIGLRKKIRSRVNQISVV